MRYDTARDLKRMFKQGRLTDLVIEAGGQRWKVHRLLLASCSSFFEDLLQWGVPAGKLLQLQRLLTARIPAQKACPHVNRQPYFELHVCIQATLPF